MSTQGTAVVIRCDHPSCLEQAPMYGVPKRVPAGWTVVNGYAYCPKCWKQMEYLRKLRR